MEAAYDVVYVDRGRRSTVLASDLPPEHAATIARNAARRRGTGRMFQSGSEPPPTGEIILIVDSGVDPSQPGPVG